MRNFGELQCTVYRRTNLSPTSSFPLPQIPIHHNDSSLNFLFSPPTPHPQFKNRKFGVNGITDDGIDLWCHPSHLIIGVIYCCIHGKLYTHTHTHTHTHIYIEREKNNSPNMLWFETGFYPNVRPTRGLFQGLVRQCGSCGSDLNDWYIYVEKDRRKGKKKKKNTEKKRMNSLRPA